MRLVLTLSLLASSLCTAQSFVRAPQGIETVQSKLFEGAEISYKKTSICETTDGVKAYSGYVTLPKQLLPDAANWENEQSAHVFFWYFESRNDPSTSPTSIYLGGGPGSTSLDGLSGFPCLINPDSNSTTLNKFSWNNNVNMLYIDQPVGTGFTYVTLQNGLFDVLAQTFEPVLDEDDLPPLNHTTLQATLDVSGLSTAANTTMSAARTTWAFAQVWFNEFPKWKTENDEVSLWSVSYGGLYGPTFFSHFYDQNERISTGEIEPHFANATVLNLATLGLTDACVDSHTMALGFPEFARNNTYGIEIYSEEVAGTITANITAPELGCHALIDQCRALAKQGDPMGFGNNATVNAACSAASGVCFMVVQGAYAAFTDRSPFDVTQSNLTLTPPAYHAAFYNQRWVQEDLGVPLNFTANSLLVSGLFVQATGDPMILGLDSLEKVLGKGTKVALIYGDRDYRCNWYGGEAASLSIESPSSEGFRSAGYESIITNASYEGGLVREHGNLSFSRIFQAGHGAAAYQPETLSKVFERVMFGYDVATGEVNLGQDSGYSSKGPESVSDVKNEMPETAASICFVLSPQTSCTLEQLAALADGSAVIQDWVVIDPPGTFPAAVIGNTTLQGASSAGEERNTTSPGEDEPSNASRFGILGGSMLVAVATALMIA